MDDPDPTDTQLWREALEHLRAGGASHAEALEGANLVLTSVARRRNQTPPERICLEPAEEHEQAGEREEAGGPSGGQPSPLSRS